jgi:hypothetical protein
MLSHTYFQQQQKEDSMSDTNDTNETNFESTASTYASKQSALRGARRALTALGVADPMSMVHFSVAQGDDGFWHWTRIDDGGAAAPTTQKQRLAASAQQAIAEVEKPATPQPPAPQTACTDAPPSLNVHAPQRSAQMSEQETATAPTPGNTKHREGSVVQNGVRRPSNPEGACGVIWAYLDELVANGQEANLKALREKGEPLGWKPGNITSEFYAWRRFNGILAEARIATGTRRPRKTKADAEAA